MSTKNIKFKIVTPEKIVIEEEITQATIPTVAGEITILPNHRSYIAGLQAGEILVKSTETKNNKIAYAAAVSGGFIEFNNNKLVVLADTAERAEDLDLTRAEKARKKAKKKLSRKTFATSPFWVLMPVIYAI